MNKNVLSFIQPTGQCHSAGGGRAESHSYALSADENDQKLFVILLKRLYASSNGKIHVYLEVEPDWYYFYALKA